MLDRVAIAVARLEHISLILGDGVALTLQAFISLVVTQGLLANFRIF